MREAHLDDLLLNFLRGAHRVTLVNRGQVFEPLYAMRLKTPLVLIELGAGDTAPPTSLRDVAEGLSQLQHREPSSSQFVFRFHALSLLHGTKIAPLYLLRKKPKSTSRSSSAVSAARLIRGEPSNDPNHWC